MEDELRIVYESGNERGDVSYLLITRRKGRGYISVKNFYNEDAEELYKKLTEHN